MKRIPALFLTGFLCLSLAACRKEPERLSDALESQITQAGGETVQQCVELVGRGVWIAKRMTSLHFRIPRTCSLAMESGAPAWRFGATGK
ncbi:MAG: hypothetical protein SOW84_08350 [Candidatus Faecousia sp.]|nr:hypothetical protein [Candidatus Faecousia sp.]